MHSPVGWARLIGGAAVLGARGRGGVKGSVEFSDCGSGDRPGLREEDRAGGAEPEDLVCYPGKSVPGGRGSGGSRQGPCKGAARARESKSGVRFCGAGSTATRGGNGRGRCGLNQQGQRARTEERASR